MHIHQQNHLNDIIFYWYQSYHWYQWTIGLTNRIRLCILDMCGVQITTQNSKRREASGVITQQIMVNTTGERKDKLEKIETD